MVPGTSILSDLQYGLVNVELSKLLFGIIFGEFQPWPENALKIVSQRLLSDVKLDTTDFKTITKLCENLHNSASDVAREADEQMNIKLYFTQKSYIKLVATFKHLLMKKHV